MRIDQEQMENSLFYLASTDEEYARARTYFNGLDRQLKTVKALAFRTSDESSATAKQETAAASKAYIEHLKKLGDAELDYLILHERRNTAATIIDCWRSLNAARTRGFA